MIDPDSLLSWYDGLHSRTLDLVSDYAGDQLFIIEGDSLLLHCFSNDKLDFYPGFQILHAAYIVETFLQKLQQRKCNFHIVFFANNAEQCIPPTAPRGSRQRYLLAREAILHHLVENIPSTISSIQVRSFERHDSPEFSDYIGSLGVYFFMCHDGTSASLHSSGKAEADTVDSDDDSNISETFAGVWATTVAFRAMIHWFVCNGYNIALIDSVEFRDTKVIVAVVEGSAQRARELLQPEEIQQFVAGNSSLGADLRNDSDHEFTDKWAERPEASPQFSECAVDTILRDKLDDLVQVLIPTSGKEPIFNLTQRELVLVVTVSILLDSPSSKGYKLAACAMLLHSIIQQQAKLCDRVCNKNHHKEGQTFLGTYIDVATILLRTVSWSKLLQKAAFPCDLADMIDGNLFLEILQKLEQKRIPKTIHAKILESYATLAAIVKRLCGIELDQTYIDATVKSSLCEHRITRNTSSTSLTTNLTNGNLFSVLPFSNSVLDMHLKPVRVSIADSPGHDSIVLRSSKVFEELTHWHNHRRPLGAKTPIRLDDRQAFFANRRNQFFMAEMQDYAASLTNSTGGILAPEPVFVKSGEGGSQKIGRWSSRNEASKYEGRRPGSKSDVRLRAASSISARHKEAICRHIKTWGSMIPNFERELSHAARYVAVKQYYAGLSIEKKRAIGPEIVAYLVNTLFRLWMERCRQHRPHESLSIVALIWSHILDVTNSKTSVSDGIQGYLYRTRKVLQLPSINIPCHCKRALSFEPMISLEGTKASVNVSPLEFQLVHAGPYFDRSMGSSSDPRVRDFEPDRWQRDVLDQIDARKSLFVVAPTSAGKTFISFYAMKQVLEDDDSGVLVYVAPTKALVNQIAAEIQARFSKSFKYSNGKSVWAIHTRDYRINNPTGCQILVTVPHILQIMLLAPSNAKTWSPLVRRIIFDEVHCIGQAQDGVVWEQLLLLAPCPIIALSATIGNPQEFNKWLQLTQSINGNELHMIEHHTRYSDLRKYIYQPPEKFVFTGLPSTLEMPPLGLESSPNFRFLHPVASLVDRAKGIPDDLALEPRDCFTLWNAMNNHKTANFPLDDLLNPSTILPNIVKKEDIVRWEVKLKETLGRWMKDQKSPFDAVFSELTGSIQGDSAKLQISSSNDPINAHVERAVRRSNLLDTTLPLICSLHEQGALPMLIFNYDRSCCERIAQALLTELQETERKWKDSSPAWKKKIAGWEAWLKAEEKRAKSKPHGKATSRDGDREARMSKAGQVREAASAESNPYESFDPEQAIPNFLLADEKKLSPSELNEHVAALRRRVVPEWLIDALKRGIGVHHAGMNRKYRQVCEMLFRKGYLRVVIATGTLALGINMPCKTVVFAGDSVFLTALSFRQAAGRAGRRGFDFLGNVVFQGVPYNKVCRLLSSKLPDLNGHFPITTSLVLRLMILLHESETSPFAVKAIDSLLSCPRIYLGGPESKHTVLHHLRFSIEYLRQNHLLGKSGAPLNFAGVISHLYYTESSSFAFHALLSGGYFHSLCKDIAYKPKAVVTTLMLVLSHLFGRHYLQNSNLESLRKRTKNSPSLVILPPLPKKATEVLRAHNDSTLNIYAAYVTTFIKQHINEPDCILPLTGVKCGGSSSLDSIAPTLSCLPPTEVTSTFVSLSGHRDKWDTIYDLCETVRSGVWLENAVVPYVNVDPKENKPLNAYLYDFFRHGDVHTLEKANMIRKGDIWFVLNDFSLVLATIVTSLENFLKLSPGVDRDLLNVMGEGDAHEDGLDDTAAAAAAESGAIKASSPELSPRAQICHTRGPIPTCKFPRTIKREVADNWEDELGSDNSDGSGTCDNSRNKPMHGDGSPRNHGLDEKRDTPPRTEDISDGQGILLFLKALKMLQAEFNEKFKGMWA